MFNKNRFMKTLMWGGVAAAVMTGCSQSATDNDGADSSAETSATEVKHVAITAIVEHPALDAVRQGVVEELAAEGYEEGNNLEINFQSAQGNTATAGQIAKQFVGDNPDVIVAIATPSAQSVAAATNTIPIVFSAVTDPVEAKLLKSLDGSGTNVTGASDALPYEPQIDLMKQIIPGLKNVGYVYSPGEVNSTVVLKNLEAKLTPMGITVHSAPAQKSNDIAIATPSAQSVAAATNTIPIVFSAVTDPVEAKLLKSLDGSGSNVTGASDALPYEPQIDLMKQIIPGLKNVGYVYSPGEVNSTVVLKNLEAKLTPMGITVHSAPAQKSNDIAMAARSIADKVDLIYTSTDNNVVSAYESLYQVAKESKVPLMASDTGSVERGAIAALGVNYHDLGRETGKIVVKILKGEDPGTIPVYTAQSLDLYVSKDHAAEQGVELPQAVLDKAKDIKE